MTKDGRFVISAPATAFGVALVSASPAMAAERPLTSPEPHTTPHELALPALRPHDFHPAGVQTQPHAAQANTAATTRTNRTSTRTTNRTVIEKERIIEPRQGGGWGVPPAVAYAGGNPALAGSGYYPTYPQLGPVYPGVAAGGVYPGGVGGIYPGGVGGAYAGGVGGAGDPGCNPGEYQALIARDRQLGLQQQYVSTAQQRQRDLAQLQSGGLGGQIIDQSPQLAIQAQRTRDQLLERVITDDCRLQGRTVTGGITGGAGLGYGGYGAYGSGLPYTLQQQPQGNSGVSRRQQMEQQMLKMREQMIQQRQQTHATPAAPAAPHAAAAPAPRGGRGR